MLKWILIALGGVFGLLTLCCLLGFFVGIPRFRDELEGSIQDGVATEVARQIPSLSGVPAEPGDYVITESSLQQSLRDNSDNNDSEDVVVVISPTGIEVGVSSRNWSATYTGVPVAEEGRLVMSDMDTDSAFLGFVLSADRFGEAIADAVNGYLTENGLRLESLELQDGQMVLTTVAA